ncbi:MAG: protein kinase, partial [Acidobacteria bacterium]|nr:protein kinase [Acidobacteriota bacterium]
PTNLSALPTEQANLTAEGTILGTLQYMAPEQLEAKEADSRTDIFAFGAVVYEMATGKKAFEGKSQASLIAAIMEKEPRPMSELQPMTPQLLDWVVKRCLAKEPDERWQSASDLMAGLKQVTEIGTQVAPPTLVAVPPLWKRASPWSITAAVVLTAIVLWSWDVPASRPLIKLAINPPAHAPLADASRNDVAISPDGRSIVYQALVDGRTQLYLRHLEEDTVRPLDGTVGGTNPFFSPDGESVAFVMPDGQLKRVSVVGGSPITLHHTGEVWGGGSWFEDTILFAVYAGPGAGLYRISATGGEPEVLAVPKPQEGLFEYRDPNMLPGGKAILSTVRVGFATFQTHVLSLETGEQKTLLEDSKQAHYVSTGHLVFEQRGTLMAAPFDLDRLEVTGDPSPVLQGVRGELASWSDYMVSDEGTLVYVPGSMSKKRSLVWVDREGKTQPVTEIRRDFKDPHLSPDGQRLAVSVTSDLGVVDVWIYDIARGTLTPFTFDGTSRSPLWTPDGRRLTFHTHRVNEDIFWMLADGTGEAEQLTTSLTVQTPLSWSPDDVLAYTEGAVNQRDIWVLPIKGEREPQAFLATQFDERHPMFSPDGKWIAFTSNQSGQDEVYLKPYPEEGGIEQISTEGGREPLWGHDGNELFYRNGNTMMLVPVQTQPTLSAGLPRLLFEGSYVYDSPDFMSNYDLSPDGQRFLMVEEPEVSTPINVVLNWFEELKRLVPTDN